MTRPRAVFFDRDGVINVSPGAGYVTRVKDFHFMPGIIEVLAWCRSRKLRTILVTSQQGVGKGIMKDSDLAAIHCHMQSVLGRSAAAFDSIQACTGLEGHCDCRKPAPKMIYDACRALGGIDLSGSVLIGDHDRDIQMARNAGLGYAIRLVSGNPVSEAGNFLARSIPEVDAALRSWFYS